MLLRASKSIVNREPHLIPSHEYYGGEIFKNNQKIEQVCQLINLELDPNSESPAERIIFLNNKSYLLENSHHILGCTLWSRIPSEEWNEVAVIMNDYSTIHINRDYPNGFATVLTVSDTVQLHSESVSWLKSEIESAKTRGEKVTILTHHSPSRLGLDPREANSLVKHAYYTDLEHLMGENVNAWFVV